jgi:hypothetical protein
MYIGNTATQQAFTPAVDFFSGNASTTAFTLSRPVASTAQVEAVIENVVQNPGSAYTVSGNTITFTSAPPSGSNNIYVRYTSPITQVGTLPQFASIAGPIYFNINGASPLGGATNPIVGASGSANNYVQSYIQNLTNGGNSSADFTAYPSNGSDAAGWVDMGITGPSFNQSTYSVTGPNESYLFGSAPSGSGTTGNLVIATDSTGTTNAIQFYNGGFNKAKNAQSATINSNGLGLGSGVPSSGVGITFPPTSSAHSSSNANTLDDYEEGTWTPTDASGAGLSLTINSAFYTKIGRQVSIQAFITYPSTASGSTAYLGGMPFTPLSNSNYFSPSVINTNAGIVIAARPQSATNTIALINTSTNTDITNLTFSGKIVLFSATYFTAT